MFRNKRSFTSIIIISLCVIADIFIIAIIYPKFASIGTDGVSYALLAKSVAEGKGLTIFGQPHLYFSPLFSVSIAPFYLILQNPDLAAHVAMIFFALASLVLFYFVLRRLAGEKTALIGVIFLTFSGRWLWANSIKPLPLALTGFLSLVLLFFLLQYADLKDKKSRKNYIYCFILGAISSLLYLTRPEYFFIIIPLLIFVCLINRKSVSLKKNLLFLVITFFGYFLLAFPYILFLHNHTGQWIISGRVYDEYLAIAQKPQVNAMDLTDTLIKNEFKTNPIILMAKFIPHFLKSYLENLYSIEQWQLRIFGIIGFVLFGFGLRKFILEKKYLELLAVSIPMFGILLLALRHTGENGYITPYTYLFIIFIATGCASITDELSDFFNFSKLKREIFLSAIIVFTSAYFIFPVVQNYLFQQADYKPKEYQELGAWFKQEVPEYKVSKILARKPEIAFYSGAVWREISGKERVDDMLNIMIKENAQYLALDTRSLNNDIYNYIDKNDKISDRLKLVKKIEYFDNKIYLYKLIK